MIESCTLDHYIDSKTLHEFDQQHHFHPLLQLILYSSKFMAALNLLQVTQPARLNGREKGRM